jgi:hypothetical protein
MRTNRKEFPDFVKRDRLKKGETVVAFHKKQMIMKWKDKRDVILISTFHDDNLISSEPFYIHIQYVILCLHTSIFV